MHKQHFAQATAVMLALWWLFTGGVDALFGQGWYVGLPLALLAGYLHSRLSNQPNTRKGTQVQWRAVPYFLWYFLSRSLVAGLDVAKRTLSPNMGLNDSCVDYATELPEGAPRVFFMLLISLLPGTLAVREKEAAIRLHVLDNTQDIAGECARTEAVVARLFACTAAPASPQQPSPQQAAAKQEPNR